jgi:hypothetical protein
MEVVAIVLSREVKNYRKLAQLSWGLTDSQMAGMHVHHFPEKCDGGRNIPEHLYVCSPELHSYGWHDEDWFTIKALEGQRKGLKTRRANLKVKVKKSTITPEERKKLNIEINKRRIGTKYRKESKQKMSLSHKESQKSIENINQNNTRQWADPDHPELGIRTVSGLVRMQRKRGFPALNENRVKVFIGS